MSRPDGEALSAGALEEAAQALGLTLDSDTVARLLAYGEMLLRWNATYNLTAIRAPAQVLTHHLVDCLAVVPPLRRQLAGKPARVLDVGSGGGLPGAVLAIVIPELTVTCVDTVGKKAAFIRQVAAELRCSRLHAVHARVEQMAGEFDVVASRAFASLRDFCRWTRGRLGADGVWMAMKGQVPSQEMAELPPDVSVFHVEQLAVPGLDADRCLVWMRPA